MNNFLNILYCYKMRFIISVSLILFANSFYSQCSSSPCFCIQIDELGLLTIVWNNSTLSNNNLFEHQFYADTGTGFFTIGSESNPTINSFDFLNYNSANSSSSFFIKSLYGPNGSSSFYSDTINSIYFDLVNLFDGRVSLSWNHPVPINNIPLNSQYIIEKSFSLNPSTNTTWNQVVTLPVDSINYIDNINMCSSWINYRIRLVTPNCDFVSNLEGGLIEDQQAPDPPKVKLVTNDTSINQMYIEWNPSIAQDVMAYIVFKFANGVWNPLDTIYGIQNTFFYDNDLSSYQNSVVKYAIAAMDSCSTGSPPQFNTSSAGDEHNNILLNQQYDQCSGEVFLSFNDYINWPSGVSNYKIFSKNDSLNNWILLDSTNSLNYTYTIQQGNMNYSFMVAADADSSEIISISNIVTFFANRPPIPQISYISEVKVLTDTIAVKYIGENGIGINKVNIYRSINNGIDFELIDFKLNPIFPFTYFDLEVSTQNKSYLYKISVTDSCLNEVAFSNFGQSILLNGYSSEYLINKLEWNPYINWENGVENYELVCFNNLVPTFESLIVLDTLEINYEHDFTDFLEPLFDGRICYQILAKENQNNFGLLGLSTSNIVCLQNDPIVFVPNALDLNGLNNYWKPVIKMIDFSDYKVSIYNRHGELVQLLTEIDQFWNGSIMNSNNIASMGVYIFQLEFKNPEGKYFHKKGHITLIR